MVNTAAHEDAEVGAVVQTRDAAAMTNEGAQEVAAVEREAADVDMLGHDVDLWWREGFGGGGGGGA